MSKYKHLSLLKRETIQILLNNPSKLSVIAEHVGMDSRTISKEIKRNRCLVVRKNASNTCGLYNTCHIQRLCNYCEAGKCKFCKANPCSLICDRYTIEPDCKTTNRFPFVCNACSKISDCRLPKFFYKAEQAYFNYFFNISNHKKGFHFPLKHNVIFNKYNSKFYNPKTSSTSHTIIKLK